VCGNLVIINTSCLCSCAYAHVLLNTDIISHTLFLLFSDQNGRILQSIQQQYVKDRSEVRILLSFVFDVYMVRMIVVCLLFCSLTKCYKLYIVLLCSYRSSLSFVIMPLHVILH
jgi:hypothetical protein